ncbi:LOW QUALITY PROTEIN: hypothetical protein NC653_030085 [Populus alba x Populus x berolinensis]|uniref:Uncharacterized protein n=1 Tax=Populus alba x Populus x berolinensis TaxID=444605 RepID=A0AAD6LWE9_9ROSI|nr:LOW QUALITY PROTEIN: hypothetical protein NC653_030085 [Populus alba x Populus x berolinensis]
MVHFNKRRRRHWSPALASLSGSVESLTWHRNLLVQNQSDIFNYTPSVVCCFLWAQRPGVVLENFARHMSTASLELRTDNDFVRFSITKDGYSAKEKKSMKKVPRYVKMSKKAKLNEHPYRLKAKKKMNSPNPEVRIRYKLEKAKRKEAWLIEKLRKLEVPKTPGEAYDPEILTDEEKHYFKRTGEKKKNYVPVGRRGVFGGVCSQYASSLEEARNRQGYLQTLQARPNS